MTSYANAEAPTGRTTRELWLEKAVDAFRPRFAEVGHPLPEKIHISIGFGYGAKRENAKILGQCWKRAASEDGVNHVFIGPEEADTMELLVTVLHELIHVALDCEDGHRGRFAEIGTRLGFMGPMTFTPPSVELAAELVCLAETLGEFPHGKLNVKVLSTAPAPVGGGVIVSGGGWHSGPAKQGTRMRKLICETPDCACGGYTVRTTAKWLAVGMPSCPMGAQMVQED
jgi:hypothetical protein